MDKIISLKVIETVKTIYGNYIIGLEDYKKQKYQLSIHDSIPVGAVFKINTYYHKISLKNEVRVISIKQFYIRNQPQILEVEVIEINDVIDGFVVTYLEITTKNIFKMKVLKPRMLIGEVGVLNLKKNGMFVKTKPHFYGSYCIENWIFFGTDV